MPRTFFGGTYMVPDPPEFNWEPLERAAGLTFTEPQRAELIRAMHYYIGRLTSQSVAATTKDVKQRCERIYTRTRALRQALSFSPKLASNAEYQHNLQFAVCSQFPETIDFDAYIHALVRLEGGAKLALRRVREQGQTGRQDKEHLDDMVRAWHAVYRDAGGSGLGYTRSGGAKKAQGPFLDLVDTALQQVIATTPNTPLKADMPPNRDALAQRIRAALKRPHTT
jgi:hypothetical protein